MSSVIAPIRAASTQAEINDSYRLVIFNGAGTDVFLREDNGRWSFPEIEIPKFTRVMAEIDERVRKSWNIATTLLLSNLSPFGSAQSLYAVLEAPRDCGHLPGLSKCQVCEAASLLDDGEDITFFASCCARILMREGVTRVAPFARLGWIYCVQDWVQQVSGAGKITSFSQLSGSDDTCLIRFTTSSKTLWYKAVGQSDPKEFAITAALGERLPEYLPRILAFDSDRNAWLMESGGETALTQQADFEMWVAVVRRLAAMQIASLCHTPELLNKGSIDARIRSLLDLERPFFECMDTLMQQQVKNPPAPLTRSELNDIAGIVRTALWELGALDIPDVIGHSDFNPGNILIDSERSVFIDWSAAHVGSPLLTLEYLIAHFRKNCAPPSEQDVYLRRVFREQWLSIVPDDIMRQAQKLSPLVAVFACAVADDTWRDPVRLALPGVPGYLRSLARIMGREAQSLNARRT